MRLAGLSLVALALVIAGCGGGSSPSEPPPPATPVPLEGSWSGTVAITSPRTTCTLSLDLVRDGSDYIGNWEGRCPDGTQGRGIAVLTPAFFDQVLVAGLQGQPVFGGCSWSSLATRDGNRLRGDWSTPQNCQTGPFLQGRLDLTKR